MPTLSKMRAHLVLVALCAMAGGATHCTIFGASELSGTGIQVTVDGSFDSAISLQDAASESATFDGAMVFDAADIPDAASFPWLAPDCDRRRLLTLGTAAKASEVLVNFPVAIDLAGLGARLSETQTLVFTDTDGTTVLSSEHVRNPWGDRAWVRVPRLGAEGEAPSRVYAYVCSSTKSPAANAVWAGVYDGVWHLDESVAPYMDMSEGQRHGTGGNLAVAGKIGAAHRFEGSGAGIISIPSMTLSATYTVSAWVASEVPTQDPNQAVNLLNIADSMTLRIRQTAQVEGRAWHHCGGDWPSFDFSGAALVTRSSFSHLVMTFQNAELSIYVDGKRDGSGSTASGVASATGVSYLGGANPGCGYENIRSLKGALDEVRVVSRVLTPGWIATEYKNQSNVAAFAVFAVEQARP